MNWNSSHRHTNDGVRQRLLAMHAAQGVLTEALLERARGEDEDVLEIEITDFEGCIGGDDDDEFDEFEESDEDERDEESDEEENEASGSGSRRGSAVRPGSQGGSGQSQRKRRTQ